MREKIRTYIHEKKQKIYYFRWRLVRRYINFKAKIRNYIKETIRNFWWKLYIWVEDKVLDYDLDNDADRFEPCETEGEGDEVEYL